MPDLPGGTVTFLFTDIEGSTHLIQTLGDTHAAEVFTAHHQLLRDAVQARRGYEIEFQGDGFLFVFQSALEAVLAAVEAQRMIQARRWPVETPVRVRMGLHTGEPIKAADGYVGLDVHRAARICQAGWGGQILLTRMTRELIAEDLTREFSLRDLGEHRLKDLLRPERIYQLLPPGLPADFPPLRSLDSLPNNLPRQLTSFIGREREMDEVKRLLVSSSVLTVTGSGGCGKTRLTLQAAADLIETYRDGVWLVELAPLSNPSLVPQEVVSALHVREQPGRPIIDTLADYLRPRESLVILDNCEHVIAACAHMAEALLRTCPRLRILATSQQPLRIPGETTFRVPSLPIPDLDRPLHLATLTRNEAVQLFTDRARAAMPTFEVTARNAPYVAKVCHRLDGIPLAIELAAARVRVLPVEQIASRLDDRFRLLTGGSRTTLPRHQTLRATMDWSYALLLDHEQLFLRRLAVFAGGWSLEAAEAVCAYTPMAQHDALDLLSQLVEKSLVGVGEDPNVIRYRLLETVRQYAQEKLADSGEGTEVRRRHCDWHVALAEQAEPELRGPAQSEWLNRLEAEHDNLRAALEFIRTKGNAETGLRLAGALGRFWWVRGHFTEGRTWLDEFLRSSRSTATLPRARALFAAGGLAWNQGDYLASESLSKASLGLSRQLGNQQGMLDATNLLGLIALTRGDYAAARTLYEEALSLARATGDTLRIALLLNNVGLVAEAQGDYEAARTLHEQSLALSRDMGDSIRIASSLNNLGLVAAAQGDHAAARHSFEEALRDFQALGYKLGISHALKNLGLLAYRQGDHNRTAAVSEESLSLARELGDKECIAAALSNLGRLAQQSGNFTRAASLFHESLSLRRDMGDKRGIAESLESLASVACDRGDAAAGARLLAAADALRVTIGAPLPPADRPEYERSVTKMHTALGGEGFASIWAEGRVLPPEHAVEYGLRQAT